MCRRSGRVGLRTGEVAAVGTIGLLDAPGVAPWSGAGERGTLGSRRLRRRLRLDKQ